jgi:hypothetical protein
VIGVLCGNSDKLDWLRSIVINPAVESTAMRVRSRPSPERSMSITYIDP